jgi:hypothetical protein
MIGFQGDVIASEGSNLTSLAHARAAEIALMSRVKQRGAVIFLLRIFLGSRGRDDRAKVGTKP